MKKEFIIKQLGKKHGYVIEVKRYIFETLEDDLAYKDELDIDEELRDFKRFYRKQNGILLKPNVYLREFRCELQSRDAKGLLIKMKSRRSILRMLRETYSI